MYSLSKTTIGSIFTVPLEKETLPENAQKAEFAFVDSEALTYDLESVKQGDTEFVLTLNHVITETSEDPVVRNVYTSTSKAYRLTSALNMFGLKAGQKPTKIKVIGQVNTSKNSLEGATEQVWEYTVK